MNKLESGFWASIKRGTKSFGCDWHRVENSAELGTPDLNGSHAGHDAWIELKVSDGGPVRLSGECFTLSYILISLLAL